VPNSSDLVAVMAELHAALKPGDLVQTLRRVTDAAVELIPGVDGATITVEHEDGQVETAAATGSTDPFAQQAGEPAPRELTADTAARLDFLQQALEEGPAVDVSEVSGPAGSWSPQFVGEPVDALRDDLAAHLEAGGVLEPGQPPTVTTSDLARDDRYPAYGEVAVRAGVRAQAAVVLFDTARSRGVLNLYSQQAGAFDETAVLTDLFAHHSATALAYAVDFHDRATDAAERRTVGQALGIVMERYTFSEANAFALLERTAEHRGVSVRLVAQELVAHADGENTDEWPSRLDQ
jgi:hypothetical protein